MDIYAPRLSAIKPSPTKEIARKAKAIKDEGRDILNLSIGEPDFDTPDHIRSAAKDAIDNGMTHYTEVAGTLELRQSISDVVRVETEIIYDPSQITVGCGAKQVLINALLATLGPGDEVIIPAPYWVSYPDMVRLADGTPVIVNCGADDGYKLTPEGLERHIGRHTKWLLLNSPCNPTGAVYSAEELNALLEVLRGHPHVHILSDEIYRHINYTDTPTATPVQLDRSFYERTLIVSGVSKAYAMTGWRVGYGAGPAKLIKAMNKIQSQTTSHTCSIAQAAATAAVSGTYACVHEFVNTFRNRRDLVLNLLKGVPNLSIVRPDGAFYVFVNCDQVLGRTTPSGRNIENDMDFAEYLLEEVGLAIVPGAAFGAPGHIRLSYAAADSVLIEGCRRLAQACLQLNKSSAYA